MRIKSQISSNSTAFRQNYEHHLSSAKILEEKLQAARAGGGEQILNQLRERGKLPARDRVKALIDPGSNFLELSALAGAELYDDHVPSGGIVTGVGMVNGRPCMIVANDASVKGGTYYPITVKKHLRAQEIAAKNHLTCVY
jgi:acetyl-CoA carboxylase carboxyltransferase component